MTIKSPKETITIFCLEYLKHDTYFRTNTYFETERSNVLATTSSELNYIDEEWPYIPNLIKLFFHVLNHRGRPILASGDERVSVNFEKKSHVYLSRETDRN